MNPTRFTDYEKTIQSAISHATIWKDFDEENHYKFNINVTPFVIISLSILAKYYNDGDPRETYIKIEVREVNTIINEVKYHILYQGEMPKDDDGLMDFHFLKTVLSNYNKFLNK